MVLFLKALENLKIWKLFLLVAPTVDIAIYRNFRKASEILQSSEAFVYKIVVFQVCFQKAWGIS